MYNSNYIEWGQQGWTCPKCGRVYSPTQPMCFYCGNQKTWTSPTTTNPISTDDSAWWEEYLKQSQTGHPYRWWEDYCRKTTGDSMENINKGTTWSSETTCSQSCDTCDKYEKSCFDGIETTSSKAIISHKKPLETNLEWYDSLDSFIKRFQD